MIDSFRGKYSWLSNFALVQIIAGGITFDSVEAAFQASKCANESDMKQFEHLTPGQAKRLGRKIKMIHDWNMFKYTVMETLLIQKFNTPKYKKLLIETGEEELVEGNTWNDTYWGVCRGRGQNKLGELLMKIRKELK